ncbi:Uncharacterized protein TrispH2_004889 [Trichoplax sp. H2]|nr:Uncharacterized protein TrispH2_004889 [Trichoplax sp. H2]|eukprot:RDD42894.1 Uncharacterized protein TrispH2_004889 [Trichoplax sp. H2]
MILQLYKDKLLRLEHNSFISVIIELFNKITEPSESQSSGAAVAAATLENDLPSDTSVPLIATEELEETHKVTFTVTVSQAIPRTKTDLDPFSNRKKVYESPKAESYYHYCYNLFPNLDDQGKVDVVAYGPAVKIYTENESKVQKTWQELDQTWIAWTQSQTVNVDTEFLLKLFEHQMVLRMWDSKDKVSAKARFDRPKAFRLPSRHNLHGLDAAGAEQIAGVQAVVLKQTMAYLATLSSTKADFGTAADVLNDEQASMAADAKMISRLGRFAGVQPLPEAIPSKRQILNHLKEEAMRILQRQTGSAMDSMDEIHGIKPETSDSRKTERISLISAHSKKSAGSKKDKQSSPTRRFGNKKQHKTKKQLEMEAAAAAVIDKSGNASISIDMSAFFGGKISVTKRIDNPTDGVLDMFVTVSIVDGELMSDKQKRRLNPMTIQINTASSMPDRPLSCNDIRERCIPSYTSYGFYNQPNFTSSGRPYDRDVTWNETQVILMGTLDKGGLLQYLTGPPLVIEIHDRDAKPIETNEDDLVVFGQAPDDENIHRVNTLASRKTTYNPFKCKLKPWSPYGEARYNLSDLLLGERVIKLAAPIQCCASIDPTAAENEQNIRRSIRGSAKYKPIPAGHYLEFNSELSITINIAYPLEATLLKDATVIEPLLKSLQDCPFTRVVYIFSYENKKFLHQLFESISAVNANALELTQLPQKIKEAALSTYKLNEEQRCSHTLDIITGFQILDSEYQVFILEGLAEGGIKTLWQSLPHLQHDDPNFKVLYDSSVIFDKRLYAKLDLTECKTLREAIRNDYFPCVKMVLSMSREFGMPLTDKDLEIVVNNEVTESQDGLEELKRDKIGEIDYPTRSRSPLLTRNELFAEHLRERQENDRLNFIKLNMSEYTICVQVKVKDKSEENRRSRPSTVPVFSSDQDQEVYHYSIQSRNSNDQVLQKIRRSLNKEMNRNLFTYSTEFHSATFAPVNCGELSKEERQLSRQKWRSSHDFVYPGVKTSRDSNSCKKKPTPNRLEELKKPWIENELHANILKPTLDRTFYSWPNRSDDFDLYRRPDPYFNRQPVTIHLAGDSLRAESQRFLKDDQKVWEEKLVVKDTRQRFHRCNTAAEQHDRGPKASCQLDKLKGLLKDEPAKLSLRLGKGNFHKVPALSVVNYPNIDAESNKIGNRKGQQEVKEVTRAFTGGPIGHRSWLLENNFIPCEKEKNAQNPEKNFKLYYSISGPVTSKRHIKPLTAPELHLATGY